MRLNDLERNSIKKAFKDVFKNGEIYLFGSRVDDNKRGGDIDLYIIPQIKENLREKKSLFLSKLYEYIGEQKIDIIIAKDKNRLIEQEAIKNGVRL
jgi:predicted nucleotidyltransferase